LGEYLVSIVAKSYRKLLGEEENYIEGTPYKIKLEYLRKPYSLLNPV
jgi:hypothetical protein